MSACSWARPYVQMSKRRGSHSFPLCRVAKGSDLGRRGRPSGCALPSEHPALGCTHPLVLDRGYWLRRDFYFPEKCRLPRIILFFPPSNFVSQNDCGLLSNSNISPLSYPVKMCLLLSFLRACFYSLQSASVGWVSSSSGAELGMAMFQQV